MEIKKILPYSSYSRKGFLSSLNRWTSDCQRARISSALLPCSIMVRTQETPMCLELTLQRGILGTRTALGGECKTTMLHPWMTINLEWIVGAPTNTYRCRLKKTQ